MSQLSVLTFADTVQAGQALEALQEAHCAGYATIDDAAVVVKETSGKVEIKNQVESDLRWVAVVGSLTGLLVDGPIFPVLGAAQGAAGGDVVAQGLLSPDVVRLCGVTLENAVAGAEKIQAELRLDAADAAVVSLVVAANN